MIPAPQVVNGKLQMNHEITYQLQPIDYLKVVLF